MKRLIVLGGGIAGLACAYRLQKRYGGVYEICLLEGSDRLGGWVASRREGGFFFEKGPRTVRPTDGVVQLVAELGLQKEWIAANSKAMVRAMYAHGKVRPIPRHPLKWPFSALMRPALPGLCKEWRVPPLEIEESVDRFFERRFGRYVADYFAGALVQGIYAGDPKKLSMQACFPRIVAMERQWGSLTRALLHKKRSKTGALFSFTRGLETLTQALGARLGPSVHLEQRATALSFSKAGVAVSCEGRTWEGEHLFSCLPAPALSPLISLPQAQTLLESIPFHSLTLVHLGYLKAQLPFQAFGYLAPPISRSPLLGMTFDSAIFPQQNTRKEMVRLTAMLPYTPDGAEQVVLQAARDHLGICQSPDYLKVDHAKGAIPQYTLGHLSRVASLRALLSPHITLYGSSFSGPALADSIDLAKDDLAGSLLQ